MNTNNKVWMIGKGYQENFSDSASYRYGIAELKDKPYSHILFGSCNLRCVFCFQNGSNADSGGIIPESNLIDFNYIKSKTKELVRNGQVIRISGGEPTNFTEEVRELADVIREEGGFSILDTNGTNPSALSYLANHIDMISIDGPKASLQNIEEITQTPKAVSWDLPIRTLSESSTYQCKLVEYKVVVFDPIDYSHLAFLAERIPSNSILTIKNYRDTTTRKLNGELLQSVPENKLYDVAERLIEEFPKLQGKLTTIKGSTRKKESYHIF
jgi:organic radical activating enzyme